MLVLAVALSSDFFIIWPRREGCTVALSSGGGGALSSAFSFICRRQEGRNPAEPVRIRASGPVRPRSRPASLFSNLAVEPGSIPPALGSESSGPTAATPAGAAIAPNDVPGQVISLHITTRSAGNPSLCSSVTRCACEVACPGRNRSWCSLVTLCARRTRGGSTPNAFAKAAARAVVALRASFRAARSSKMDLSAVDLASAT